MAATPPPEQPRSYSPPNMPLDVARLPIPGNAEFALWLVVSVLDLLLCWISNHVLRLKGVFRIEHDEWVLVNRAGEQVTVEPIAYRRDSRVEVFVSQPTQGWGLALGPAVTCGIGRS